MIAGASMRMDMIDLSNIHSISDLQRNPKEILGKLKKSGRPIVLTVNGRAELVVQDAASYQNLLDKVRDAEDFEAVREGIEQSLAGKVRPVEDFFGAFEKKHGL